jgi:hypothetical protein
MLFILASGFQVTNVSSYRIISSNSNSSIYTVRGQAAVSIFEVETSPLPVVIYSISRSLIDNSSVQFNQISNASMGVSRASIEGNISSNTMDITLASGTVSGLANITLLGPNQIEVQSPPQLMSITLTQNGNNEGVWNGFLDSSGNASGFVYYNPDQPAELVLQYENFTRTENTFVTIQPKINFYSVSITALQKVQVTNVSGNSNENLSTTFQLQTPERFTLGNSGIDQSASYGIDPLGMNSTPGYFNGAEVPGIQWTLKGYGSFLPSRNINAPDMPFNATVLGLYGINGTTLGFVNNAYGVRHSSIGGGAMGDSWTTISFTAIASSNYPNYVSSGLFASSSLTVGNSSILLLYGTSGEIESNANVSAIHNVILNGNNGTLFKIEETNSITNLAVIFSNDSTGYVSAVSPANISKSNFDINGANHLAQMVQLANFSARYVVFGVPLLQDVTSAQNLEVFKNTPNGLIRLETQNYYISNGELEIFDDPSSTTYYVVYSSVSSSLLTLSNANEIGFILITILIIATGIYFIKRGIRRPAQI